MRFMLHLIYFDSCKIPGLIIRVNAVKTQVRVENQTHILSRQLSQHLKIILPEITGHIGDSE